MFERRLISVGVLVLVTSVALRTLRGEETGVWQQAKARSALNQEALQRVDRVLEAWLKKINPETGLPPQRYDRNEVWTVANSAADLYSSLVLDAAFVNRAALEQPLGRALVTEREHAERIGHLPDDLNVHTLEFIHPEPSLARSQFGASEWCRDGLLRITETLGPETPWFGRLTELVDEIMTRADIEAPYGPLPGDIEVCGEMLQTLSRLHALTGDEKYRKWAEQIGDYYLFENPPHKLATLRLRDHGGEILSGLAEMYAMTSRAAPSKAASYQEPLQEMLDRVMEIGQMPSGMFANIINPRDGKVISVGLRDRNKGTNTNWGYTCNAHCTFDLVSGSDRYGDRIRKALAALPRDYAADESFSMSTWRGSSDYFADFLENAMVLYNRYPVDGIEEWVFQAEDGTVNRHYHDGSFGRTSILFARLCSRGVRAEPWRSDLRLGAFERAGVLYVWVQADKPWSGRLLFDYARSREDLHLPVNYPRINELTEWYVVSRSERYEVSRDGQASVEFSGTDLVAGMPLELANGQESRIVVRGVGGR
jgi:hypothetical protein